MRFFFVYSCLGMGAAVLACQAPAATPEEDIPLPPIAVAPPAALFEEEEPIGAENPALVLEPPHLGSRIPAELPAFSSKDTLTPTQSQDLAAWFKKVGPRHENETFGQLVIRAAAGQFGKPYVRLDESFAPERLWSRFDAFGCQTLVESALALGHCIWQGRLEQDCYLEELQKYRYVDGKVDGYASKFHYFVDWIDNNEKRGRVKDMSGALGARKIPKEINFMSKHRDRYPLLKNDDKVLEQIIDIEKALSAKGQYLLDEEGIAKAQSNFQDGDIMAIVGNIPGLYIRHVGFFTRAWDNKPRFLHASTSSKKVMLTKNDITSYIARKPNRLGVLVIRPQAPKETQGSP
jgi:hypothetical protein